MSREHSKKTLPRTISSRKDHYEDKLNPAEFNKNVQSSQSSVSTDNKEIMEKKKLLEFMQKQRQRRRAEEKPNKKLELELRKEKLKELSKKSLQIVSDNVKRSRSKSRDRFPHCNGSSKVTSEVSVERIWSQTEKDSDKIKILQDKIVPADYQPSDGNNIPQYNFLNHDDYTHSQFIRNDLINELSKLNKEDFDNIRINRKQSNNTNLKKIKDDFDKKLGDNLETPQETRTEQIEPTEDLDQGDKCKQNDLEEAIKLKQSSIHSPLNIRQFDNDKYSLDAENNKKEQNIAEILLANIKPIEQLEETPVNRKEVPSWLQPAASMPYPNNFISSIKRKLNYALLSSNENISEKEPPQRNYFHQNPSNPEPILHPISNLQADQSPSNLLTNFHQNPLKRKADSHTNQLNLNDLHLNPLNQTTDMQNCLNLKTDLHENASNVKIDLHKDLPNLKSDLREIASKRKTDYNQPPTLSTQEAYNKAEQSLAKLQLKFNTPLEYHIKTSRDASQTNKNTNIQTSTDCDSDTYNNIPELSSVSDVLDKRNASIDKIKRTKTKFKELDTPFINLKRDYVMNQAVSESDIASRFKNDFKYFRDTFQDLKKNMEPKNISEDNQSQGNSSFDQLKLDSLADLKLTVNRYAKEKGSSGINDLRRFNSETNIKSVCDNNSVNFHSKHYSGSQIIGNDEEEVQAHRSIKIISSNKSKVSRNHTNMFEPLRGSSNLLSASSRSSLSDKSFYPVVDSHRNNQRDVLKNTLISKKQFDLQQQIPDSHKSLESLKYLGKGYSVSSKHFEKEVSNKFAHPDVKENNNVKNDIGSANRNINRKHHWLNSDSFKSLPSDHSSKQTTGKYSSNFDTHQSLNSTNNFNSTLLNRKSKDRNSRITETTNIRSEDGPIIQCKDNVLSEQSKKTSTCKSSDVENKENSCVNLKDVEEKAIKIRNKDESKTSDFDKTNEEKNVNNNIPAGEFGGFAGNPNQPNVKFDMEFQLLNDFHKSLHRLIEIDKSWIDLQGQTDSPKSRPLLQNKDTSILSSNTLTSVPPNKKTASSHSKSERILPTITYSRGSEFFDESIGAYTLVDDNSVLGLTKILEENSIMDMNLLKPSEATETSIMDLENNTLVVDNSIVKETPIHEIANPSLKEVPLGLFEQLIKEEDARLENLKATLLLREKALLDGTKGELAWLEIQKKHFKDSGRLQEVSAIKKKQRGIIIKLQQEKHEMHRLKQMQKAASKERKTILKKQTNLIKAELTLNSSTKLKKNSSIDIRPPGPIKAYNIQTKETVISETLKSETSVLKKTSSIEEVINVTSHTESVVSQITEDCVQIDIVSNNNKLQELRKNLLMKEAALQKRRVEAENLLKWHQKLIQEEKEVSELEMAVCNQISLHNMTSLEKVGQTKPGQTCIQWRLQSDTGQNSVDKVFDSIKSSEDSLTINQAKKNLDERKPASIKDISLKVHSLNEEAPKTQSLNEELSRSSNHNLLKENMKHSSQQSEEFPNTQSEIQSEVFTLQSNASSVELHISHTNYSEFHPNISKTNAVISKSQLNHLLLKETCNASEIQPELPQVVLNSKQLFTPISEFNLKEQDEIVKLDKNPFNQVPLEVKEKSQDVYLKSQPWEPLKTPIKSLEINAKYLKISDNFKNNSGKSVDIRSTEIPAVLSEASHKYLESVPKSPECSSQSSNYLSKSPLCSSQSSSSLSKSPEISLQSSDTLSKSSKYPSEILEKTISEISIKSLELPIKSIQILPKLPKSQIETLDSTDKIQSFATNVKDSNLELTPESLKIASEINNKTLESASENLSESLEFKSDISNTESISPQLQSKSIKTESKSSKTESPEVNLNTEKNNLNNTKINSKSLKSETKEITKTSSDNNLKSLDVNLKSPDTVSDAFEEYSKTASDELSLFEIHTKSSVVSKENSISKDYSLSSDQESPKVLRSSSKSAPTSFKSAQLKSSQSRLKSPQNSVKSLLKSSQNSINSPESLLKSQNSIKLQNSFKSVKSSVNLQRPISPQRPLSPQRPKSPQRPMSPQRPKSPQKSISTHSLISSQKSISPQSPVRSQKISPPSQVTPQKISPQTQLSHQKISSQSPISAQKVSTQRSITSQMPISLQRPKSPKSLNSSPNLGAPLIASKSVTVSKNFKDVVPVSDTSEVISEISSDTQASELISEVNSTKLEQRKVDEIITSENLNTSYNLKQLSSYNETSHNIEAISPIKTDEVSMQNKLTSDEKPISQQAQANSKSTNSKSLETQTELVRTQTMSPQLQTESFQPQTELLQAKSLHTSTQPQTECEQLKSAQNNDFSPPARNKEMSLKSTKENSIKKCEKNELSMLPQESTINSISKCSNETSSVIKEESIINLSYGVVGDIKCNSNISSKIDNIKSETELALSKKNLRNESVQDDVESLKHSKQSFQMEETDHIKSSSQIPRKSQNDIFEDNLEENIAKTEKFVENENIVQSTDIMGRIDNVQSINNVQCAAYESDNSQTINSEIEDLKSIEVPSNYSEDPLKCLPNDAAGANYNQNILGDNSLFKDEIAQTNDISSGKLSENNTNEEKKLSNNDESRNVVDTKSNKLDNFNKIDLLLDSADLQVNEDNLQQNEPGLLSVKQPNLYNIQSCDSSVTKINKAVTSQFDFEVKESENKNFLMKLNSDKDQSRSNLNVALNSPKISEEKSITSTEFEYSNDIETFESEKDSHVSDLPQKLEDVNNSNIENTVLSEINSVELKDLYRNDTDFSQNGSDLDRSSEYNICISDSDRTSLNVDKSRLDKNKAKIIKSQLIADNHDLDINKFNSDNVINYSEHDAVHTAIDKRRSKINKNECDVDKSNVDISKSGNDETNSSIDKTNSDIDKSNSFIDKSDLDKSVSENSRSYQDSFENVSGFDKTFIVSANSPSSELNISKSPQEITLAKKKDARETVSETLANVKSPLSDLSPTKSSEPISPSDSSEKSELSSQYGDEAEELFKKQMAIEHEIEQLQQQLMREIPNKPPPPYMPPAQTPPSVFPKKPDQIDLVLKNITSILYNAYINGTLANVSINEEIIKLLIHGKAITKDCFQFVFNLCKESTIEYNNLNKCESDLPWMQATKKPFVIKQKPLDKAGLEKMLKSKVKQILRFEPVVSCESSTLKWTKKSRDYIDEIVISEALSDQEWKNIDYDELIVLDRAVNDIFKILMRDAADGLEDALNKKGYLL